MASTPPPLDPASLGELLSAATKAHGEPMSGELVRALQPTGVIGALAQMPLTEILQNMDFGKRSGRVDVWLEGAEGTVHVHDGQIVHALAITAGGRTDGEAAIAELCRRPAGFFRIHYARDDVDRNVHRPTTFVLLEALRTIDEASASRSSSPAAVDLGLDPWGDAASGEMLFPPLLPGDDDASPFNDPSAVLDIEVAAEAPPAHALQQHPRFRVQHVIDVLVGDVKGSLLLEDIGRGGAFLRSETMPTRGSMVTLRLPFPEGALDVPARIVHLLDRSAAASVSREPGIGVRFEELAPKVATRLGAFVDQLAAGPAGQGSGGGVATPRDRLLGLVAESEFLVAAGDLESAQRVLSQAHGLAPEDDELRRKLHNVNEAIDAARAHAFLEQAMRGGPRAVELARRATELRPVRDVLLRSLAVFARGGAHDEVADVAEQLLELDPDDEGALRTLLDANMAMKRWSVAVRAAESLLLLRPDDEQLKATLQKVVGAARQPP